MHDVPHWNIKVDGKPYIVGDFQRFSGGYVQLLMLTADLRGDLRELADALLSGREVMVEAEDLPHPCRAIVESIDGKTNIVGFRLLGVLIREEIYDRF